MKKTMKNAVKKIGAAALCLAMSVSVLAGCGSSGAKGDAQNGTEDPAPAEDVSKEADTSNEQAGDWEGEVTKIIMTFPTKGVEPPDLRLVQDAVNEVSIKKIGVEVEFKPVPIFELAAQCPMWIGAGERIDLMCIAFIGLQSFIEQGMIEPLDEWIAAEAPYIQKIAEEYPVYDITPKTDEVYGVTAVPLMQGSAGGYLISVSDLEAAGLNYKDGDLITLDDLDTIFAKIKEVKPDSYPCGVIGTMDRAKMTFISDMLGATEASGVIIGLDSTEVVNLYASEEYKNYLDHVRSWYEKGYILKDAATTDVTLSECLRNETISGYFSEGDDGLREEANVNTGREYIHLLFNEPYLPSLSSSGSYWTVPVTSEEPEAAVRFLNLMEEDPAIANTLMWGVEGKHYELIDAEQGIIGYPEGVTQENTGYDYSLGIFPGNQADWYVKGNSTKEGKIAWTEIALTRKTKAYGFAYDASAMTNQITAVEAVINEYVPALTTGSADLETTYAEFINKLEANGINEIIADKQAQFDEWLGQQ